MRNTSAFQPKTETLLNGLVSYWKLDESSGDAVDLMGVNNLTNTNTVGYAAALINNGADFGTSNTNKRLTRADSIGITSTSAFSISGWVKLRTEISSGTYGLFSLKTSGSPWAGRRIEYQYNAGTRRLAFIVHSQTVATVTYNITLGTSDFYHLTITYSGGTAGTITAYVNGVSQGTATANITNNFVTTPETTIASYEASSFASIYADEVGIWNRALTTDEISILYSNGNGRQVNIIPNTTKAYYPLNGNSRDFSGNTNTGTDTAITYPQGRFGQAAKFNGSSSYITAPDSVSLSITGQLTISCLIKTTTTSLGHIVEKDDESGFNRRGYNIYMGSDGTLSMSVGNNSGYPTATTTKKFNDNKWHNVVGVYTPSTSIRVYVDGVLEAISTTSISASITDNTRAFNMGYRNNGFGPDRYFNGLIDEVIIESRAWTAKEVETYYRKSMLNYKQRTFAQALLAFLVEETLSLTESISNLRARAFTTTETLSLSEVWSTLMGKAFTVADSLGLVETFNSTRTWAFTVLDSLNLSENVSALRARLFTTAETLGLIEAVTAVKSLFINISESLNLTEGYSYVRTFIINVQETLSISEIQASVAKKWNNITKSISTWTKGSKNSSTWTPKDKA
jgi:hypothetical protein